MENRVHSASLLSEKVSALGNWGVLQLKLVVSSLSVTAVVEQFQNQCLNGTVVGSFGGIQNWRPFLVWKAIVSFGEIHLADWRLSILFWQSRCEAVRTSQCCSCR